MDVSVDIVILATPGVFVLTTKLSSISAKSDTAVGLSLHAMDTIEIKTAMAIRYNKPFPFLFNYCHFLLLRLSAFFKFSIYKIIIILKKSNSFLIILIKNNKTYQKTVILFYDYRLWIL